jgi:hypothetical protein
VAITDPLIVRPSAGRPVDEPVARVAQMMVEVDHLLARHAVEDVSPDDALLLTIEALLGVAQQPFHDPPEKAVSAQDLAPFDEQLLEPLIRRGQEGGFWSSTASAASLALSLRSLISGLVPIGRHYRQDRWALARTIRTLFVEAAGNAAAGQPRLDETQTARRQTLSGVSQLRHSPLHAARSRLDQNS